MMTTIAHLLTNPAMSGVLGLAFALALWGIRNRRKLDALDTFAEWGGIIVPALAASVIAWAFEPSLSAETLVTAFLLKLGVGVGWNGPALLPGRRQAPKETP
jgi:hypothetical protein